MSDGQRLVRQCISNRPCARRRQHVSASSSWLRQACLIFLILQVTLAIAHPNICACWHVKKIYALPVPGPRPASAHKHAYMLLCRSSCTSLSMAVTQKQQQCMSCLLGYSALSQASGAICYRLFGCLLLQPGNCTLFQPREKRMQSGALHAAV